MGIICQAIFECGIGWGRRICCVTGIQTMEAGAQIRMTSAALTSALTSFPARQPSIGCCLRKR